MAWFLFLSRGRVHRPVLQSSLGNQPQRHPRPDWWHRGARVQNPAWHQQSSPQLGLQGRCGIALDPAVFARGNLEWLVIRTFCSVFPLCQKKAIQDTARVPWIMYKTLSTYCLLHPGLVTPGEYCGGVASLHVTGRGGHWSQPGLCLCSQSRSLFQANPPW